MKMLNLNRIVPNPIKIRSRDEYDYCLTRGYEPLVNFLFYVDIKLRIELQNELFSRQSPENDIKFYNWVWENKLHYCEETGRELFGYSAKFISHILSRSGYTEYRYDGRNTNILNVKPHGKWDYGKESEKRKMKIWRSNQKIIQLIKSDYKL